MQTVGPAPAGHLAAGKFVNDDDFAVFHNVIYVALVKCVRAQALIDVVNNLHVRRIVEVTEAEHALAFADAFFGERRLAVLLVERVINVLDELGDDFVDAVVLVSGFFGGTGNDQRSARLVDEDGIHFVNDGEVMPALHAIRQIVLHVVAQVIETELVVRAVGDVRTIGGAPLLVVQIVDDDADTEAQGAKERAHPFRVAARQIVVDGDDVHAAPGESVERRGEGRDERLALARFHFRDFAFVQNHSADELHIEVAHIQEAAAGLAHQRERQHNRRLEGTLHQLPETRVTGVGVFELLPHLGFQLGKAIFELFVAQGFDFGFAGVDGRDEGLQFLDVALVLGADKAGDELVDELS